MAELRPRLEADFGPKQVETAIAILTLMEYAWHDCYGEPAPPPAVLDDVLIVATGDLAALAHAALEGVQDWRDLQPSADEMR